MARKVRASSARLDKLKLIPQNSDVGYALACQPGLGLRATKGDEAQPAEFLNRAAPFTRFNRVGPSES
jgi:hypothetical protein